MTEIEALKILEGDCLNDEASPSILEKVARHSNHTGSMELKEIIDKLIDQRGNLDMRSVTRLIWLNRNDKHMIQTITEKLIANSNERTVFNGIEFYLPQLAHMIIHLDVDISSAALEQFALVVCQVSLHVALQLNWILVAAMEDYQPELANGEYNPKSNPTYFTRCIKLLQNVERIVALGSPGESALSIAQPKERLKLLADQATHVIASPDKQFKHLQSKQPSGFLLHKRWIHRSGIHRRGWVKHWFCLLDRVLYCHTKKPQTERSILSSCDSLKRAIVLHDAKINHLPASYKQGKYRYYFTVESPMGCWRLRAESLGEAEKWVHALQDAAGAPPVVLSKKQTEELASVSTGINEQINIGDDFEEETECKENEISDCNSSDESKAHADLSPAYQKFAKFTHLDEYQSKRYEFFNSEREFVRNLTDICEELRFVPDRNERGPILEERLKNVMIPPVAYLPLVKSTDPFRKVLRITPDEATPFSTKARCPALITFETCPQWLDNQSCEIEEEPLDVANFMHWNYASSESTEQRQELSQTSNALDGFGEVNKADLVLNNGMDNSTGFDVLPTAQDQRRTSFFNSLPLPHLPHMPLSMSMPVQIGMQNGTRNSITSEATTETCLESTADGATKGYDGARNVLQHVNAARPRPNVWRPSNTNRQPNGLFSPFGGRSLRPVSFKVLSIQVPKMLMRWGSDSNMSPGSEGANHRSHADTITSKDEEAETKSMCNIGARDSLLPSSLENKIEEMRNSNSSFQNGGVTKAYQFLSYGESLDQKVARLKKISSDSSVKGWKIERIICKSNDDLRQEVFVMQLISFYLEVFQKESLDLWLQPYRILSTGKSTGLIQVLDNSISLHGMKKKSDYPGSLSAVFEAIYGADSEGLDQARRRFAQSLAGYSVVGYLLGFKDRHNGNIMITADSRIVHIDFGFVFGMAPGNKFSMERASFKLTQEYVDAMGGKKSEVFKYFNEMVAQGLVAARKYASVAITLMEIMMFQSEFPCFANGLGAKALRRFKRRLMLKLSDEEIAKKAAYMVESSLDHPGTILYDKFQFFSNGILR
mmetsp:Transcript_9964/g.14023  ORF Transcript_9964/g.14023 Transcript_9964/m.14023 type:complete len:1056 (-) Transcript_9964:155-3322(-)